ncbi:acyltransferase [Clostridium botulinum]|nr:acyltransferase [Clostridium botulinum]
MKTINNKLIKEYDIMRIIVVILVILGHSAYYTIHTNYGGIDYFSIMETMNVNDTLIHKLLSVMVSAIYSFHMPLFVALSGALFSIQLSKNKYPTLINVIKDKFFRLIVPFFIVSFFYSIPLKLISGYYYFKNFTQVLKDILLGQILLMGNSHLWFLLALFIDFVIIYLMKKYYKGSNGSITIILVLIHFISFKITIPLLANPLKYAIWFYMGYSFEGIRLNCNKYIERHKAPIVLFIFIFIFSLNRYIVSSNFIISIIKEILSCFCAVLGSFIVYSISYLITIHTRIIDNKHIQGISKNSFGLYLYSDSINYILLFLFFNIFTIKLFGSEIGSIIIFLSRVILTSIIALIISKLLKKSNIKYIC